MPRSIRQAAKLAGVAPETMRRRLRELDERSGGQVLRRGRGPRSPISVSTDAISLIQLGTLLERVPSREEFVALLARVDGLEELVELMARRA